MALKVLIDKLKIDTVHDISRSWKWASVQISALGIVIMGAAQVLGQSWTGMPPSIQDRIPHADTIAMILFGATLVGRVLKKKDVTCAPGSSTEKSLPETDSPADGQ